MRRLGIALVAVVVMAGCGGSTAGVGQAAADRLGPEVAQVTAAVTSGDQAAARAKLAGIRATVADLRQRDQLSEAGAAKVLAAAAGVEAELPAPPPTQPPQASTTAPPAQVAPGGTTRPQTPPDSDKGRGKGNGKDDD